MIYLSLVEYVLHKFLTGICVVSSVRKIVSFFKNSLILLSSLSKFYHETDCHSFDEYKHKKPFRGGSRAAVASEIERFVIIVNGWKPLTIIAKRSILDVAAALDPPLPLWNHLGIATKLKVLRKTSLGRFPRTHSLTHRNVQSWQL